MAKVMKKIREEKGLSVRDLADIIQVNYSSISLWENGKRKPRSRNATLLEKELGKSIIELMKDDKGD